MRGGLGWGTRDGGAELGGGGGGVVGSGVAVDVGIGAGVAAGEEGAVVVVVVMTVAEGGSGVAVLEGGIVGVGEEETVTGIGSLVTSCQPVFAKPVSIVTVGVGETIGVRGVVAVVAVGEASGAETGATAGVG